jgi:hypothetical protein
MPDLLLPYFPHWYHDCPMRNRLVGASATVSLSLSRLGNHRHPEILPSDDPAASTQNTVPEMVR